VTEGVTEGVPGDALGDRAEASDASGPPASRRDPRP